VRGGAAGTGGFRGRAAPVRAGSGEGY
jgi:hypothetical protein